MGTKKFAFFLLIVTGLSCRKSNYAPPVTPVLPDSLMNWTVVSTQPGKFLSDIWFTSTSRGFALGDKIYQTNDGGQSWAEIPNTPKISHFLNLFFVNSQVGFAEGTDQLATTVDGGISWTIKPLPSNNALTIFFADPSTGFYGDESGVGLKKTTDAGDHWVTVFVDPGTASNYYPCFINSDTGYVATGSGTFASTTDGGQNWRITAGILPVNQFPDAYNQLFFAEMNKGFYACPSGIIKTVDGGQSWQQVLSDSVDGVFFNSVNTIRFADANTVYYKGLKAIYKSSDGGQTWSLNCKLGSDDFLGIYFLDVHTGWACTSQGRILKIQQ